jgi:hypothetical protein
MIRLRFELGILSDILGDMFGHRYLKAREDRMQSGGTLFVLGYLKRPTLSLSEGAIGEVGRWVTWPISRRYPNSRIRELKKSQKF